jgi:hypothetical protein
MRLYAILNWREVVRDGAAWRREALKAGLRPARLARMADRISALKDRITAEPWDADNALALAELVEIARAAEDRAARAEAVVEAARKAGPYMWLRDALAAYDTGQKGKT